MESLDLIKQKPPKSWWTPILVMVLTFVLAGGIRDRPVNVGL